MGHFCVGVARGSRLSHLVNAASEKRCSRIRHALRDAAAVGHGIRLSGLMVEGFKQGFRAFQGSGA